MTGYSNFDLDDFLDHLIDLSNRVVAGALGSFFDEQCLICGRRYHYEVPLLAKTYHYSYRHIDHEKWLDLLFPGDDR